MTPATGLARPPLADVHFDPPTPKPGLYARLSAAMHDLGRIPPTGKNPFGGEALSIGDVEAAIRPLLVEHGVLTLWTYVALTQLDKSLWMAHLKVRLQNADAEADCHEDEWIDIGNNPMAATSFARKGYLKALFHIAEPGDDKLPDARGVTRPSTAGRVPTSSPGSSPAPSSPANHAAAKHTPTGRGCPECGEGSLELVQLGSGARWIGCTNWNAAVPCKYREKAPAYVPNQATEAERQLSGTEGAR